MLGEGVAAPSSDVEYPGGEFASVSVGEAHVCGLRPNGEAACWGANWFGQTEAPQGPFAQVDAGSSHSCGLRPDGTVVCWGEDSLDAANLMSGGYRFGGDEQAYASFLEDYRRAGVLPSLVQVLPSLAALLDLEGAVPEAEVRREMARRAEGWAPPAGPFVSISAGRGFSCGLRVDGEAVCWGFYAREEPRIPLEVYAEVYGPRLWDFYSVWESRGATEKELVVRLRSIFDPRFYSLYEALYGTRVWELDPERHHVLAPEKWLLRNLVAPIRLMDPPPGPFIAVEAGSQLACGLRPDGEIECWGREDDDSEPPPGPVATEPIKAG